MTFSRSILALLVLSCAASFSLADDGGAIGGICRPGEHCPLPGQPGHGGPGGIDPSPYDPQPGQPHHPNPGHPQNPPQSGRDRREVYVGQYLRDQDVNLLSLFNLSIWNDRGMQIDSVEVMSQPGDGRATLSLVADGYLVDSENYPSYYSTLIPNRSLIIGETLRSYLSLAVRGKLFVERIAINFRYSSPYPPNPPGQNQIVLQGSIYQSFYGPGSVDLARATNLMNYRGYRLSEVIVNGRTLNMNQGGSGRLMANGMIEGYFNLYSYENAQSLRLQRNYVVGQNLDSLTLLLDGNASISTIQLRLTRY